jgi:hypothetical protein
MLSFDRNQSAISKMLYFAGSKYNFLSLTNNTGLCSGILAGELFDEVDAFEK